MNKRYIANATTYICLFLAIFFYAKAGEQVLGAQRPWKAYAVIILAFTGAISAVFSIYYKQTSKDLTFSSKKVEIETLSNSRKKRK